MSRPTINDVARLAGVSKKTVSRVINNSPLLSVTTRAKVQAVIAETGYVPDPQARALALGRSMQVALVHDGALPGVIAEIEAGLLQGLAGSGYTLTTIRLSPSGGVDELAGFLAQHRPSGVVLDPHLARIPDLVAACDAGQVKAVMLGGEQPSPGLIASQDRIAMARLVAWLVRIGHRRIGLIAGPDHSITARERELGYLDAMADHDLDRGPSLIVAGDNGFASGAEGAALLLEVSPRPTAIIACSDEMAAGVVQAAARRGLSLPDDLSIAAFDDTPLAAQVTPSLTAMRVPWAEMAQAAAGLITERTGHNRHTVFVPNLSVRESVSERGKQAGFAAEASSSGS